MAVIEVVLNQPKKVEVILTPPPQPIVVLNKTGLQGRDADGVDPGDLTVFLLLASAP